MAPRGYELLRERALIHFESLLAVWKIDYVTIGKDEYDFLSPTRKEDKSFGACRFNCAKGIGADFAGLSYSRQEFERVGQGFSREDFAGFTEFGEARNTFDIIGLTQRIHDIDSYWRAADRLKKDLDNIDGGNFDNSFLAGQIAERQAAREAQKEKMRLIADRQWKYGRDIKGTIGETYLNSRNIWLQDHDIEPNMKFNGKVFNAELVKYIPAVLFKVSASLEGELKAIHRVWIAADGSRKARLTENKKALGSIEGNGIWFGTPHEVLYVCEGPEEGLTIKYVMEKNFVVSTVYATNYHNLTIPDIVKLVILVPDEDPAGLTAAGKAHTAYSKQNKKVVIHRKRQANG